MKKVWIYSYDMDGKVGNWNTDDMFFVEVETINMDDSLLEFVWEYVNENAQEFCIDSDDIHVDGDEENITVFSKQTIYGTLDYYHPVLEFVVIKIGNEQFDSKLAELLTGMDGAALLAIPGLYEVVAEELNNAVLEALEEEA